MARVGLQEDMRKVLEGRWRLRCELAAGACWTRGRTDKQEGASSSVSMQLRAWACLLSLSALSPSFACSVHCAVTWIDSDGQLTED